jgi:4-aminobutyrate aminotransferase-like enzyme
VVTTPEVAQVLTRRCYFNTFGGNPLCTAGGLAVLEVLEKERLQENAFVVGSYLKDRLRGLQEKHESECLLAQLLVDFIQKTFGLLSDQNERNLA